MKFQNEQRYELDDNQLRRFESRFIIDDVTGCWVWTGNKDKDGYGRISLFGQIARAHRVSYEHYKGVKANKPLDHIVCDNKSCVNPDHLVEATIRENTLRGNAPSAHNARKQLCINGHEFDKVYYDKNGKKHRGCKKCHYEAVKAWRQRRRDLGLKPS